MNWTIVLSITNIILALFIILAMRGIKKLEKSVRREKQHRLAITNAYKTRMKEIKKISSNTKPYIS